MNVYLVMYHEACYGVHRTPEGALQRAGEIVEKFDSIYDPKDLIVAMEVED